LQRRIGRQKKKPNAQVLVAGGPIREKNGTIDRKKKKKGRTVMDEKRRPKTTSCKDKEGGVGEKNGPEKNPNRQKKKKKKKPTGSKKKKKKKTMSKTNGQGCRKYARIRQKKKFSGSWRGSRGGGPISSRKMAKTDILPPWTENKGMRLSQNR